MSSKKSFQKLRTANRVVKQDNSRIAKPMSRMITPLAQVLEEPQTVKQSVFFHDTTFSLCKKLVIYKLMGNDLFLNYAAPATRMAYTLMGKRITNGLINATAGSIFTSGEDTTSLKTDIDTLSDRNIGGIGNYVVEGLEHIDNLKIDNIEKYMVQSLLDISDEGQTGHFALKLSALLSIEAMRQLSDAQEQFTQILLTSRNNVNKITAESVLASLQNSLGVQTNLEEVENLISSISFNEDKNQITDFEVYSKAHLFKLETHD
jgi:hypothetical protein